MSLVIVSRNAQCIQQHLSPRQGPTPMKQRLSRQQLSVSHLHFRFHLSHRRPNWA